MVNKNAAFSYRSDTWINAMNTGAYINVFNIKLQGVCQATTNSTTIQLTVPSMNGKRFNTKMIVGHNYNSPSTSYAAYVKYIDDTSINIQFTENIPQGTNVLIDTSIPLIV